MEMSNQTGRHYSISEIDQMREWVRHTLTTWTRGVGFVSANQPTEATLEVRLRTYMLNGTDPAEIEKEASKNPIPGPLTFRENAPRELVIPENAYPGMVLRSKDGKQYLISEDEVIEFANAHKEPGQGG